jgi:hypothetical protein
MKKTLVLFMAFGFLVSACNNNKNGKTQNTNNREKDDYGKNENVNTGDEHKTNENTGNTGWAASDKSKFLKVCVESFDATQGTLANQICPCVLGKLEKKYASYTDADTPAGEADLKTMALQCKEEISPNTGDNNNNHTATQWSASDEDKWMQTCSLPSLVKSFGESKTNNYCRCVLGKLEEIYSSYDDMNRRGTTEMGEELGKQCANELTGGNQ